VTPKRQNWFIVILFFATLYWGITGVLWPQIAAERHFGVLFLICDAGLLVSLIRWKFFRNVR
jgi:hypothetical protein